MQLFHGTTWIRLCSILSVFAVSSTAQAQYDRFRLPEGRRCTVGQDTFQCFDLSEYRELLHIDNDLRILTLSAGNLRRQVENLENQIIQYQALTESLQTQRNLLAQERTRLRELWREENRKRLEAENSTDFMSVLGWSIATVALVGLAAYIIYDVVSSP